MQRPDRSGQVRFTALLHHVNVAALERAFKRMRRAASAGVDGVTVEMYTQDLQNNLQRLCERVNSGQYWPKPVRRTYIPKADGGQRPLGITTLEDKIVQSAVAEVLSAIYEVDVVDFSFGFRPGRSAHMALAQLDQNLKAQKVNWILDVDIRKYFDSVDHGWLLRMVAHRVADPRVLRLIERSRRERSRQSSTTPARRPPEPARRRAGHSQDDERAGGEPAWFLSRRAPHVRATARPVSCNLGR